MPVCERCLHALRGGGITRYDSRVANAVRRRQALPEEENATTSPQPFAWHEIMQNKFTCASTAHTGCHLSSE